MKPLPREDVRLPDGRRLRYKGPSSFPRGAHEYGFEGLHIIAEQGPDKMHVSLSRLCGEVTRVDAEFIKPLFFDPEDKAIIICPGLAWHIVLVDDATFQKFNK